MSGEQKERRARDLPQRTVINGIVTLFIIFAIFVAEYPSLRWVFTAAVASISGIAVWEYCQLLRAKGIKPAVTLGIVAAVLYVLAMFFKTQGPHPYWGSLWHKAPEIILALSLFGCFVNYAYEQKDAIISIASMFLGIMYIAVPFGLFVRVMYFFTFDGMEDLHLQGSWWIVYLLAVTKSADMGGYFVGCFFGKRKLAQRLSPKKTMEGAFGGLIASVLVSLLVCFLGRTYGHVFQGFTYISAIWLGAIIGVVGQVGDLAESLLKRDAGVKDSNTLPAVGGILDMADSILFTTPVLYLFLKVFYT